MERTNKRDIRIIRAIEDGNYVFVHAYQDIDNGAAKWITTDLFDTDKNDKIVEHWDVIAAYQEPSQTQSGNDMILGAFELKDLEKTEDNKALVRMFLTDVFQNRNYQRLDQYVSSKKYIQHNPNVPDGVEAVAHFLNTQDFNYDFVFRVIGQGYHVVSFSQGTQNGEKLCIFDVFRVEDNKIVEHWDNMEPIPPRSEWANAGKF